MSYITEKQVGADEMGRLRVLPTAAVSDALDALGIAGQLLGISRRTASPAAGSPAVAGRAFTVKYEPVDESGGTVGDFLDDVPSGSVVVIENGGRADCTVWGGIMSRVAAARQIAGTVIDGACRDLATSDKVGYPLWSAAVYMRTGKDRVRCAAVQAPLCVAGVRVESGDYVLADADGAVVVPAGSIEAVLRIAEQIEQTEDSIARAAAAGQPLSAAREDFAYHSLQSARGH